MFKTKEKYNNIEVLKKLMRENGGNIAGKIGQGVRYTSRWYYDMGKNPTVSWMKNSISKRPAGTIVALMGLGLAIFGLINLIGKKRD